MALPDNAQNGDIGFDDAQNTWHLFDNGQWIPFPAPANDYMNQNYSSVSGTGVRQTFNLAGTDTVMSKSQVEAGVTAFQERGGQPTRTSAGPQGERIADAYCTWTNDPNCKWPPTKIDITSPILDRSGRVTGYSEIQDTEAIDQFLTYAKQNNIRFTDAELEAAGTPQAVDIGGQQYFQQPGFEGQFERIPQELSLIHISEPTRPY